MSDDVIYTPSGRTLDGFAERSRLLKDARPMSEIGITSLKQVTWEHQRAAMAAGYNGVTDMAVDELFAQVQELRARVDALEARATGRNTFVGNTYGQKTDAVGERERPDGY